nr:thiamine phosphate synthase [Glycomyces sambucus]
MPSPGSDGGVRARAAEPNPAADDRGLAPAAARTSSAPVASRAVAPQHELLLTLEAALAAGAGLIQIRPEDHYTDRAAFDLAVAVAELCDAYGAVCLVNDRVHIAQSIGADGVHLGADDLPIDAARRLLPDGAVIGGTCRDSESARAARRAGATYLGVGPVWSTTTKTGLPQPIGLDGLAAVCAAVDLPVIAIGGITAERAALCREAGAYGVAVVGAVAGADDPAAATAELLAAVGEEPTRLGTATRLTGAGNTPRSREDERAGAGGAPNASHFDHPAPNGVPATGLTHLRETGPARPAAAPHRPTGLLRGTGAG